MPVEANGIRLNLRGRWPRMGSLGHIPHVVPRYSLVILLKVTYHFTGQSPCGCPKARACTRSCPYIQHAITKRYPQG